ncbi:hypothetical protein BUALT_Bualt10G0116900 [Buddleja alternifolia]|uniref:Uncharacterized protein n=1 Tax=Buddleja alternifolia TaxID=168488 RepID=A0AAV6WX71_9LAMI|nr:hypothetical protein BUALT_Bualt10G0116900 [Buddleja alternifolia]
MEYCKCLGDGCHEAWASTRSNTSAWKMNAMRLGQGKGKNYNEHSGLGFLRVNRVLGQTYGSGYVSRVKMGVDMPVLGGKKEFATCNLFAIDCVVVRFNGTQLRPSEGLQFANLKSGSGLDGRGVVCKR